MGAGEDWMGTGVSSLRMRCPPRSWPQLGPLASPGVPLAHQPTCSGPLDLHQGPPLPGLARATASHPWASRIPPGPPPRLSIRNIQPTEALAASLPHPGWWAMGSFTQVR